MNRLILSHLIPGVTVYVKDNRSYTVDVGLNNYKVGGKTIETTSVVLDNIITVNGGFKLW